MCFTAAQLALETALLPEAAAILTSIPASEPSLPSRRVTNCPVTDEDGISMEMLIHLGIYCEELACSAGWGRAVGYSLTIIQSLIETNIKVCWDTSTKNIVLVDIFLI